MSGTIPQHLKDSAKRAEDQGWVITRTGSGHLKWTSPRGTVVYTPKTPGGGRSHQNVVAKLQRAGLKASKTKGQK